MRIHRHTVLGTTLLAFAGAAASSSKTLPPPGELMLVVSTDASPPKDIDTLHVEVSVAGQSDLLNADYELGSGPDGILVPATLGLVAGRDPSAAVSIRVYARKGGHLGKVRVLREATVTVPTDRVAMLRMPINWLCYDNVADVLSDATGLPTGEITKTECGPDQTCAAGACVDATFSDPMTLPDFTPDQVFGGDAGDGGGTCFDTLACFTAPTLAAVDPPTCTIAKPTGGAGVNVAMEVATGAGACEPAGAPCFIALESESPEGWQTQADDASRIQLPQEVCARLASGKLAGVFTSTACPAKQVENPPCGAGSSVAGGAGDAASE